MGEQLFVALLMQVIWGAKEFAVLVNKYVSRKEDNEIVYGKKNKIGS